MVWGWNEREEMMKSMSGKGLGTDGGSGRGDRKELGGVCNGGWAGLREMVQVCVKSN